MPRVIISDTSTLILFNKNNKFEILKEVYGMLIITPEIALEFRNNLPNWIIVEKVSDTKYQELLETQLDKGEASAIALAIESGDALLLLDDLKARKLATKLGLKYTGTLGIINKAKEIGIIKRVKPLIESLLKTDFRISQNVISEFLRVNDEIGEI